MNIRWEKIAYPAMLEDGYGWEKRFSQRMYIDDRTTGTGLIRNSDILEPINLGSAELLMVDQLVDIKEEIAGVKLKRKHNHGVPKGVNGRNSENTMILDQLEWEPSISLKEGMANTDAWIESEMLTGVAK